jgi:hypothetical protein
MHKSFFDSKAEFNADSEIVTASARRGADHEFGSQGTELKLSVVESYLRAFTRALREKFPQLGTSTLSLEPENEPSAFLRLVSWAG